MSFRPVVLPPTADGRLWLASMPGRFEPWAEFVTEARRRGLGRIVCLAPLVEVARVSPAYHAAILAQGLPCGWQALAMQDHGVGAEATAFQQAIEALAADLAAGESLLLHCAAGIGRTGTVAACVLKVLGLSTAEARQRVRQAGSNPQSALQSGWIEHFGA